MILFILCNLHILSHLRRMSIKFFLPSDIRCSLHKWWWSRQWAGRCVGLLNLISSATCGGFLFNGECGCLIEKLTKHEMYEPPVRRWRTGTYYTLPVVAVSVLCPFVISADEMTTPVGHFLFPMEQLWDLRMKDIGPELQVLDRTKAGRK